MGFAVNESQAIYQFLSGFGIPAYASTSVPDQAELPYITYEYYIGDIYSGDMMLEVNVWYRTESEAVINSKAREVKAAVPKNIKYDNGTLWIKRGSPLSFSVPNEDKSIKCKRVNLLIEYLSNN